MTAITSTTGVDGVIASGNTPTWVIQADVIDPPLTNETTEIPMSALNDPTTVKADCHFNMGDAAFTRTPTTRDRKRACETITVTVKTGETIEGTITAVYDQQAEDGDVINAVYDAMPTGSTVYVFIAYGWPSQQPIDTTMVGDVYRGTVQMRAKNSPVEGEDLTFTSTLAVDLYLEDVEVVDSSTPPDDGGE